MRKIAEKILLWSMVAFGTAAAVFDLVYWPDAPSSSMAANIVARIPSITLIVLCTITLFLILEQDKLSLVEQIAENLERIDIAAVRAQLLRSNYGGISQVFPDFPREKYNQWVSNASRGETIRILYSWIPNLVTLEDSLLTALYNGAKVEILLLHPMSPVAKLRGASLNEDIGLQVRNNLSRLADIYARLSERQKKLLQVKLYNSPLSVAMHQIGNNFLLTVYFQKEYAVNSPQLWVTEIDTELGRALQREFRILWEAPSSKEIDLRYGQWPIDLFSLDAPEDDNS